MAIKLKFDCNNNVEEPTLVLSTKSGRLLGQIPASGVKFKKSLNSYSDLQFDVYKVDCSEDMWNQLVDFKLIWAREWNVWFELYIEVDEGDGLTKIATARTLGDAELSQIGLYNIEINTELDIEREDYKPTVLYDKNSKKTSLIDRLLEKAPHYKVGHVDSSIASIQRTFSFNGTTIYDAFKAVSEEIKCIFLFDCKSDKDGNLVREINVYDLEDYCVDCGYRGEIDKTCPECGKHNILKGYGEDTSIYISTDNLANNINYSTDEGSVKNCFRLEAGDDLMTATVINTNPNGSGYIWYLPKEFTSDMSAELSAKIDEYNKDYDYYYKDNSIVIPADLLSKYNKLIDKYKAYSDKYSKLTSPIKGYPDLMNAFYDTIDFNLFLKHSLMPSIDIPQTDAKKEALKLNSGSIPTVAVQDMSIVSDTTINNAVLGMARTIVDPRYQVRLNKGSVVGNRWTGSFIVTRYSNAEDTATSVTFGVTVNDKYEEYLEQKLEKITKKSSDEVVDIVALFKLDLVKFKAEIKKYSLIRLVSFSDACQKCLDALVEQGVARKEDNVDLYYNLYVPYYEKKIALAVEMKVREGEIAIVSGVYDTDGFLRQQGVQSFLDDKRTEIQDKLNFEKYLGEKLWLEFSSYRREDTYHNDNYISDGLNNAELFKKALEFAEVAKKEIIKSATLQHSISSTLKNFLVMKEFQPIVDKFEVGNWLRLAVNGSVYRLRLVEYSIDFDSLDNLSVVFSDVKMSDDLDIGDLESVIEQSSSLASSYGSVQRQAKKGNEGKTQLDNWVSKGLALTNTKIVNNADDQNITFDTHGLYCREFSSILGDYDEKQLKIINRGLYLTDDNWRTSRAGIGEFSFYNPKTQKVENSYGVIADTLVGSLILAEEVGVYSKDGSIQLDEKGLTINNGGISISNPQGKEIFGVKDGNMFLDGSIVADGSLTVNSIMVGDFTNYVALSQNTATEYGFKSSLEYVNQYPVVAQFIDENWLSPISYNNKDNRILISRKNPCKPNDAFRFTGQVYNRLESSTEGQSINLEAKLFMSDGSTKQMLIKSRGYNVWGSNPTPPWNIDKTFKIPSGDIYPVAFELYITTDHKVAGGFCAVHNLECRRASAGEITAGILKSQALGTDGKPMFYFDLEKGDIVARNAEIGGYNQGKTVLLDETGLTVRNGKISVSDASGKEVFGVKGNNMFIDGSIVAKGVSADSITAGILKSKKMDSSGSPMFYFDLDSGAVRAKNATITGTFTAQSASNISSSVTVTGSDIVEGGTNTKFAGIRFDNSQIQPAYPFGKIEGIYLRGDESTDQFSVSSVQISTKNQSTNASINLMSYSTGLKRILFDGTLGGVSTSGIDAICNTLFFSHNTYIVNKSSNNTPAFGISPNGNVVVGDSKQYGTTNIYTNAGGTINFFVGGKWAGYIDAKGWHNGAPPKALSANDINKVDIKEKL